MIDLSRRTREHIAALFAPDDVAGAERAIAAGCQEYLNNERIHFSVVRLSAGNLELLGDAIKLAQSDYRDLFVSAHFANDTEAHTRWEPTRLDPQLLREWAEGRLPPGVLFAPHAAVQIGAALDGTVQDLLALDPEPLYRVRFEPARLVTVVQSLLRPRNGPGRRAETMWNNRPRALRPFLTARWESLVFLNYQCPPALLEPLVPRGTVLDSWKGETLVSLVGFLFTDTRIHGVPVPFHRTFEEVNLRFYVRRTTPFGENRRAVVFIRELVPRHAIAAVARWVYNEPYLAVPMAHHTSLTPAAGGSVSYSWRYGGEPFVLGADVAGPSRPLAFDSEAEFITEHFWGYTRQRDGGTLEYKVEHPSWYVWECRTPTFTGPAASLYGAAFGDILAGPPRSALVASGSEVVVYQGIPPDDGA